MRGGEFAHVSRDDIQRFEQGIAEHLEQFGGRASILLGHHVPEDRCVPYQIARTDECAAKPPRCFRCGEAAVNPPVISTPSGPWRTCSSAGIWSALPRRLMLSGFEHPSRVAKPLRGSAG